MINRRQFIKNTAMAGALASVVPSYTEASSRAIGIAPQKEENATPNTYQKDWMKLKFGMFVHFGINTYYDKEWSDGTLDPIRFNPVNIDTDQWCRVAKAAGMKYIVITTKHHDGFALWPSKYSEYTVAASPFKKDVVGMLAKSAQKFGLKLGLYYSIWDEHDVRFKTDWWAYMDFMYNQVEELLTRYGDVVELWLDGFWKKQKSGWSGKVKNIDGEAGFQKKSFERDLNFIQSWRNEGAYWWQMDHFYQFVKSLQPGCQVMNNSTTAYPGVPLHPVDIRSGEKYSEVVNDQKVWNWLGEDKYFPLQIETTMSVKGDEKFPSGNWFWHEWDHSVRPVDEIKKILNDASSMQANLLLNVGITNEGLLRPEDENQLLRLRQV